MLLRYMAFFGSFTPKPMLLIGTPSWLPYLQYTAAVLGKALRRSIRNLVLKRQYKVTVKKGKSVLLALSFGDVLQHYLLALSILSTALI